MTKKGGRAPLLLPLFPLAVSLEGDLHGDLMGGSHIVWVV